MFCRETDAPRVRRALRDDCLGRAVCVACASATTGPAGVASPSLAVMAADCVSCGPAADAGMVVLASAKRSRDFGTDTACFDVDVADLEWELVSAPSRAKAPRMMLQGCVLALGRRRHCDAAAAGGGGSSGYWSDLLATYGAPAAAAEVVASADGTGGELGLPRASSGTPESACGARRAGGRRVSFAHDVKAHDGLESDSAAFDAVVAHFILGHPERFAEALGAAQSPWRLCDLADDLVRRITDSEGAPVLPRGGGRALKLASVHLPSVMQLMSTLAYFARETCGGAGRSGAASGTCESGCVELAGAAAALPRESLL